MASIFDIVEKHSRQLIKLDQKTLEKIIRAYGAIYERMMPYIRNVEYLIQARYGLTVAQLVKTQEYISLIRFINEQIGDFSAYMRVELDSVKITAAEMAISHVNEFFSYYGLRSAILASSAIDVLTEYLSPDGVLMQRIALWSPHAADSVSNAIIEGLRLGRNPRVIAADIRRSFGVGLTDALRTTRTVQMWSYRESTRANYIANADIVKGWIWFANLGDDRTCMSCIAMHGTVHPLSEPLNDHHNGRCTMLPLIEGINYIDQLGEEWFNAQSEERRIKLMGKERYRAYKDGKFTFDRLSSIYNDEVFGEMRVETSLKGLLK